MPEQELGEAASVESIAQARALYLDERHQFGCAETVFMTLKSAYGLDDPTDPAAAAAFNGGFAYSGGLCGAMTGAALAVGMLAERRMADHASAKRVARELVAATLDEFRREHGAVDCRDLIGYDLRAPGGHEAFLASGTWRDGCMGQIEWVVARLALLADEGAWACALSDVGLVPAE